MEKKHKVDDDGEEDTDNDDVDADKKQGYKVLEGWESIRWRDTGASDGVHSVNTILMRTLSHNTREIQRHRQMQIQIHSNTKTNTNTHGQYHTDAHPVTQHPGYKYSVNTIQIP